MEMKKVVAYVRISSMRQVNNESPSTQREAIRRYAEQNNMEIVEWFEDIAKSAKNADRDGLQDLLKYCLKHRGEIDHWVVYNMKRASRDNETYTTEVKLVLRKMGITVRSATEPAVDDTKEGRFMETLLVALGQLDNEGKAEVTIDNMRALALQGYWQHPPVVGYDTHKISNDLGKMRPSLRPNEMAVKVTKVLERFSEGDITKAELARFAAKIGLKTRYGKKIGEDSLHRMIKNPVYAGYISDSFTAGELIVSKHEPLISQATFERNQLILYPKNSRKNEVHLQKNSAYPLKGLVLCINCNNPLYASAPKTGSGSYSPRYHCARVSCKGKVSSIKAGLVHEDFTELLTRIKPSEGILKLYKRVLIGEANQELGRLNSHIRSLRDQLSDLDRSRVNALRKFAEEEMSLAEKNELISELDIQKTEKTSALADMEAQQNIRETDIEQAIYVMESVDKQWEASELDIRMRFQSMLFPRGLVYDAPNHRFGTSEISPLYRCIDIEKGTEVPLETYLVAQVHSNWNDICIELLRWKKLIGVRHQLFPLGLTTRT